VGPVSCGVEGGGGSRGAVGEEAPGSATEEEAAGKAAEDAPGAVLAPYREGKGHHVPAKRAFTGDPDYDIKGSLTIPNSELDAQGILHHDITGAQQTLYREFAKTGQPVTWDVVRSVETEALIRAGMSSGSASATVDKAISALQASGVSGPVHVPWGGK
jgi:hypothetical protein